MRRGQRRYSCSDLCDPVREAMDRLGLRRQADVSQRTGVSAGLISKILTRAPKGLNYATVRQLVDRLGLDVEAINSPQAQQTQYPPSENYIG